MAALRSISTLPAWAPIFSGAIPALVKTVNLSLLCVLSLLVLPFLSLVVAVSETATVKSASIKQT